MMKNSVLLILCVILTPQTSKGIAIKDVTQLRDIISEAEKQLEELKSIIEGDILKAHDDLANVGTDFLTFANNVLIDGGVSLHQEHQTILEQLIAIKDLAHSAGKDVSSCTDHPEYVIDRLPGAYNEQIFHCIYLRNRESEGILKDSKQIGDISINKVHQLERQLRQCGNAILCVESVVREIQLDMIRLPAKIKTEVNAAEVFLNNLRLLVQQCADVKVSEYVSEANSIISDVIDCVNKILNKN